MKKKRNLITKKTLFVTLLSLPIIVYLGFSFYVFLKQDYLIFVPFENLTSKPEDFNVNYERVIINVSSAKNQENLFVWWLKPEANTTSKKEKIILLFHGSDGNISDILPQGIFLQKMGFAVFLLEYRGYGKSKGDFPSEEQVFQDAQIAYDYLINQENFKSSNIILYGHSLGGAVAINLAFHNPEIAGLILQSTITNMTEIFRLYKKYKYLPLDFIITEKFSSIDKIGSLKMPLLFLHGTADHAVPYTMSEELFSKATSSNKKLVLIPDADHVNFMEIAPETYQEIIEEFYQSL